jgi:hypothetical protein
VLKLAAAVEVTNRRRLITFLIEIDLQSMRKSSVSPCARASSHDVHAPAESQSSRLLRF